MPAAPTSFPKGPLLGAATLVALTIALAGSARVLGLRQPRPASSVVTARDLAFLDRPDGSVTVRDAGTGNTVGVLAPGTNGFIRASLRSLARRRRLDGEPSQTFRLTAWADGRLTLDDPSGANPVELEAFGRTNEEAFAKLLGADEVR